MDVCVAQCSTRTSHASAVAVRWGCHSGGGATVRCRFWCRALSLLSLDTWCHSQRGTLGLPSRVQDSGRQCSQASTGESPSSAAQRRGGEAETGALGELRWMVTTAPNARRIKPDPSGVHTDRIHRVNLTQRPIAHDAAACRRAGSNTLRPAARISLLHPHQQPCPHRETCSRRPPRRSTSVDSRREKVRPRPCTATDSVLEFEWMRNDAWSFTGLTCAPVRRRDGMLQSCARVIRVCTCSR